MEELLPMQYAENFEETLSCTGSGGLGAIDLDIFNPLNPVLNCIWEGLRRTNQNQIREIERQLDGEDH